MGIFGSPDFFATRLTLVIWINVRKTSGAAALAQFEGCRVGTLSHTSFSELLFSYMPAVIMIVSEQFSLNFSAMYTMTGIWNCIFMMLQSVTNLSKLMKYSTRWVWRYRTYPDHQYQPFFWFAQSHVTRVVVKKTTRFFFKSPLKKNNKTQNPLFIVWKNLPTSKK